MGNQNHHLILSQKMQHISVFKVNFIISEAALEQNSPKIQKH